MKVYTFYIKAIIYIFFAFPTILYAQTPVVGDNCSNAISIPVNATCMPANYSTAGATNSGLPNTSCGGVTLTDLWFQVTVPLSGHIQITVLQVTSMSLDWAIYTGTCGTLTEIECNHNYNYYNINSSAMAGQTLYIRVWRYASSVAGTFSICASDITPPVNDYCANAINIATDTICNYTNYSNTNCTADTGTISVPSCGGYQGGDIWFTTTIPPSGHISIQNQNVSGGINSRLAIYTGTCGALTEIDCRGPNDVFNIHNHAMAGQTLYLRVWDFTNPFKGGNFQLCVWEPNTPENDTCAYAIPLTVGSTCSYSTFTNYGCTAESSSVSPTPSCGAFQGGDVWFTVVIPSSGHLTLQNLNVSNINVRSTVYTGTCGAMNEIACMGPNAYFNIHDHTMQGQTLFIRVWNFGNEFGGGIFKLCAWEPNTPENDSCQFAIPLTVGSTCNYSTHNNLGCTSESTTIAPNPSCGAYQGGDVWFTLQVPSSGHLVIGNQNVSNISTRIAIYTGSCGAFTEIACIGANTDFNLHNHNMGGVNLYIRVWDFNDAFDGGTFNLCAWEPNIPENDSCAYATPLTVGSSCNFTTYSNIGCTAEASSVSPAPTCGFYQGGDVWFTLVMPASGHLIIERENYTGMNAQFAVYTGTCGAMTQLKCAQLKSFINFHDHSLVGQTLYIRVWDYNSATEGGSFGICAWEPNTPENDFCANAIPITVNLNCSLATYNNIGCTSEATSIAPNPTCGFYSGGDIWFTFTMPNSGLATIERVNGSGMNAQFAVYSGSCGSLTQVACAQLQSSYSVNNIALAGQTLYLRVYNYNTDDGGTFTMCVYDPTCLLTIDSVSTNPTSCNLYNDGSLSIYANCAMCQGAIEYSINNGNYQLSNTFSGLAPGFYSIKIRDSGKISCSEEWIYNANITSQVYAPTYFEDLDGDNYGKNLVHITTCGVAPANYVLNNGDCNDSNPAIHPGAFEINCNSIDENCNGNADDSPIEINIVSNCHTILDGDMMPANNFEDGTHFGDVKIGDSLQHDFIIENNGISNLLISSLHISGTDSASYQLNTSNSLVILPNQSNTMSIKFKPTSLGIKNAMVSISNDDCDEFNYDFSITGNGTNDNYSFLHLNVFIEGYYVGNSQMAPVLLNQGLVACPTQTDTLVVELHDTNTYNFITEAKAIVNTNGTASFRFTNINGWYYLVLKHRNAIQTWSSLPVYISSIPTNYNFTVQASSAYGSNVKEVESGVWALFAGDFNYDENIDLLDKALIEMDIESFQYGYFATDINGDGNVDLLDNPTMEININNFVYSVHP
ncbi:MAG: choice-of-anchor D domain-containing protein [Bacteroidetes bacterium]|nr:choice-of-anchor D domain-containing protein [Bacteroidota bacterium]